MEQPSYYSILTANVRYDKELKANEKLLFSEITALSNKSGYCHATNKYFAKLYSKNTSTISDWINHLKQREYLKVVMVKDGKQIKERRLFPISNPIRENPNTPSEKSVEGYSQKNEYPIRENPKENITSINTTSINKNDDQPVEDAFNLAQLAGINVNSGLNLPVFTDYINRLGNELVCYAIKRTNDVAQHPSWSYLKTVLKSLEDNHVKTVEQAEKLSKKYGQSRKGKSSPKKAGKKQQYHFETHEAPEGMSQDEFFAKELAEIEAEDKAKEAKRDDG